MRISKTFGEMWVNLKQGHYQVGIAQLICGIEKDFMFELEIPPVNFKVTDQDRNPLILNAVCQITSADENNKVFNFEAKMQVTFFNENENLGEIDEDGEVMVNYYRVKAAEAMELGVNFADKGQY